MSYCEASKVQNKRICMALTFFDQKWSGNECLCLENCKELEAKTWYFFISP